MRVELEDLRQIAPLTLVLAPDQFDPERGANCTAYAGVTIHGKLKRYPRDHDWAVRSPRQSHDTYREVQHATRFLTQSGPVAIARHRRLPAIRVRMPWTPKISFTISPANTQASWAPTCVSTSCRIAGQRPSPRTNRAGTYTRRRGQIVVD